MSFFTTVFQILLHTKLTKRLLLGINGWEAVSLWTFLAESVDVPLPYLGADRPFLMLRRASFGGPHAIVSFIPWPTEPRNLSWWKFNSRKPPWANPP